MPLPRTTSGQPAPNHHHDVDELESGRTQRDRGATLTELLVVIVILGLLIAALSIAVTGMKSQAAEVGCAADRRHLHTAIESYFAQRETRTIPATGLDHDRYERTLVDAGVLRQASEFYDLGATGVMTMEATATC